MQQKATNNIRKRPPITKAKPVNERNMADAHLSLFPTPTALPIRAAAHQIRTDIETKVRAHVETFIKESSYELPTPPPKVKIKMLYVLLYETYIIMNKIILKNLKETTFLLMKIEANGTLGNAFVFAFGQWYLFPLVSTFSLLKFFFLMFVYSFSMIFTNSNFFFVNWWWD